VLRYYEITPYPNDVSFNATMSLYYTQPEFTSSGLLNENGLKLYRYDGSRWQFQGGEADSLRNRVSISGITAFSTWAFSDPGDLPLPVELTSFHAALHETGVLLVWSTASETNNLGFEIQWSQDRIHFDKIGFVGGNGTAFTPHEYSFMHKRLIAGSYYYRLKLIDTDGSFTYSDIVEITTGVPAAFELSQNYPNPFNAATVIRFALPVASHVTLSIYNILGERVRVLEDEPLAAGYHRARWDGKDDRGNPVVSGVYLYQLRAGTFSQVKKISLLR
jgi:hypothetical protein